MKSMSHVQKQQGFSLVELLLVLGVIALIAIAAFIIYPSVQAGTQANTESSNITSVVAGTKNLYGSRGTYGGVNNDTLRNARIFPSTMVGGNFTAGEAKSVWGNDVTVAPQGTPATRFSILYADIPTEACIKFVSGVAANFDTVGASIADATGAAPTIKASGAAPDPAGIVTACQGAAGLATIAFVSK